MKVAPEQLPRPSGTDWRPEGWQLHGFRLSARPGTPLPAPVHASWHREQVFQGAALVAWLRSGRTPNAGRVGQCVPVAPTNEPQWPRPVGWGPVVALGKLVADQVLRLSAPMQIGGQQRVLRTTSAGGAPANVTAWCTRLGAPARLAGWAGADPIADELLTLLAGRGVATAVVRRGRTPVSTVLVHPDGERTLLSDGGEGSLEPDDVDASWLADAAVLHLDGYDLLRFPAALRTAARLAWDAGAPVSLDVAAGSRIRQLGVDGYTELVAGLGANVLFCNAAEASVLGIDDLPGWVPELVLVHAGARPTRVLTRSGSYEVPVDPLPADRVVDTTGCGDAFAAGVLTGWRAGMPVLDAVRSGHAAAAAAAGVAGAQPK